MTDHDDLDRLLGPDRRINPPRGLAAVVVGVAVLVLIGLIALWPGDPPDLDLTEAGFADELVRAETEIATVGPCSWDATVECRLYQLILIEEPVGDIVFLEFPDEVGQPELTEGEVVHLAVVEDVDGSATYQYADKDRRTLLWALGLVFATAVIALGRMRGVAALAGLALSVGILLWFILPAIIAGRDAVLVALIGGGAIALISLYLAHGYNPLTHVAALGAFSALVLTTVLSWLVVELARFSGLAGEEAFFLLALPDLDLNGLLLAGIVLGAIGALDDVTVTQASAVWEVRAANPSLDSGALFESGLRVGRDHIVSTVNTLLLAYAGASLPLLVFLSLSEQSFGFVTSSEVVAVEIVRTLVGSMGLVAAVPLTTWLAARVAANAEIDETSPRISP